ncbi:MAG: hypothetical protein LBR72_07935, partial [Oscillospiraceae bacterium]|nr:hypothetical protein [Oscillospiraceae bacterium]
MTISELVSLIGGDAAPVHLSSDTVITPDGQTVTLHVGNRQIHLTADQAAQIAAAATAEALTAEVQARETEDAALKADIETEASARSQAVAGEAAERQGADNILQAQIEDEMSYREAGDTENAQAVTDETSRAQSAEAALRQTVDAETAARLSDIADVKAAQDTERTARETGDTYNANAVADLDAKTQSTTAALRQDLGAETADLRDAQAAEEARATVAEGDLQSQIDSMGGQTRRFFIDFAAVFGTDSPTRDQTDAWLASLKPNPVTPNVGVALKNSNTS